MPQLKIDFLKKLFNDFIAAIIYKPSEHFLPSQFFIYLHISHPAYSCNLNFKLSSQSSQKKNRLIMLTNSSNIKKKKTFPPQHFHLYVVALYVRFNKSGLFFSHFWWRKFPPKRCFMMPKSISNKDANKKEREMLKFSMFFN